MDKSVISYRDVLLRTRSEVVRGDKSEVTLKKLSLLAQWDDTRLGLQ